MYSFHSVGRGGSRSYWRGIRVPACVPIVGAAKRVDPKTRAHELLYCLRDNKTSG